MPSDRDNALDMVKGFCVLAMVAHHAIEHYAESPVAVRYVRFVSGAFPFLAGFVATHIYSVKYAAPERNAAVGGRLVFRGMRLVALCALLNAVINRVFHPVAHDAVGGGWEFFKIMLFTGDYRNVSFALLVPIGYVLATLGVLQLGGLFRPVVVIALAAMTFVHCLAAHFSTQTGFYLCYICYGLLGAAAGYLSAQQLKMICGGTFAVGAYAVSLALITFQRQVVPVYAFSVAATLGMLYYVGGKLPATNWFSRQFGIWGRYTLLLYLAQIFLMFAIARYFRELAAPAAMILTGVITCIAQWAICLAMDKIRNISEAANAAYKWALA